MARYSVYSVLGDGNSWTVLKTDSKAEALRVLALEEQKWKGFRNHAHGVWDDENPELGDVSGRLEWELADEVGA